MHDNDYWDDEYFREHQHEFGKGSSGLEGCFTCAIAVIVIICIIFVLAMLLGLNLGTTILACSTLLGIGALLAMYIALFF